MTFSVITRKMWHYMRNEKKRSEATQTLQAGCSKAEPKIFAQPQTPFPGARDSQNLISWRWSPSPTDPVWVWWRSMHAISSYRGNRPTNKQTNTQTDRQGKLQYTAPLLSAQCNKLFAAIWNWGCWIRWKMNRGDVITCLFAKTYRLSFDLLHSSSV